MELGQVGRHRLDQKHELGLKEPDFGRIHPVGGQLDGEHCKGDLAIKVWRTLICGGHHLLSLKKKQNILIVGNPTLVFEYEKSRDLVETNFNKEELYQTKITHGGHQNL